MELSFSNFPKYTYNRYIKHRKLLSFAFLIVLFCDMFTTYFGINGFGFTESAPITNAILHHYGWTGIIVRFIISCCFILALFKYQPDFSFKYTSPIIWIMLTFYFYESTINNLSLMFGVNHG